MTTMTEEKRLQLVAGIMIQSCARMQRCKGWPADPIETFSMYARQQPDSCKEFLQQAGAVLDALDKAGQMKEDA